MGLSLNWILDDAGRIERAKTVKLTDITNGNTIEECHALCKGSKGNEYRVTLTDCECRDYFTQRKPCKHMIRLAIELNLLNEFGHSVEQQRAFDIADAKYKLAYWYGCYYLLGEPVVSDQEYDSLKHKLQSDYGIAIPNQTQLATSPSSDPLVSVRIYLDSNGIEYVDKTPQGGGLYFFDGKAADDFRAMGLSVSYTEKGNRATKHRPAWYLKLTNAMIDK